MKTCTYCKKSKDECDFYKVRKDKEAREGICKICRSNKSRKNHYKYVDENLNNRAALTRFLTNHFKNKPCTDCGKSFPTCAMDYDHLRDKKFDIAGGYRKISVMDLLDEIDKCDVVCAVCHRFRTVKQRGKEVERYKDFDHPITQMKSTDEVRNYLKKLDKHQEKELVPFVSKILPKEQLEKLVWEKSTVKIAQELGVSDKAVEKWCKKYCISKPPRGYWAKIYSSNKK